MVGVEVYIMMAKPGTVFLFYFSCDIWIHWTLNVNWTYTTVLQLLNCNKISLLTWEIALMCYFQKPLNVLYLIISFCLNEGMDAIWMSHLRWSSLEAQLSLSSVHAVATKYMIVYSFCCCSSVLYCFVFDLFSQMEPASSLHRCSILAISCHSDTSIGKEMPTK